MDERQQLLFRRSALLDAAVGSQSRYLARLAKIDELREDLYVNPDRTVAPPKLKLWNVTMLDAIASARDEGVLVRDYMERVREIDERLAQLPPAA